MKRWLRIREALVTALMLFLATSIPWSFDLQYADAAEARRALRLPVLTCPLGCGIYEWWATYEKIFEENHSWLRVSSQETPGFVYNIKEMATNKQRWPSTIFGGSAPTTEGADKAIKPFFTERIPSAPWKYLYPISGRGVTTWAWVTTDPQIKSMKDFQGKRLGLGLQGQINWGFWPTVFLEAMGVKAQLEYLGPLPAIEALIDGRVSAAQVNAILTKEKALPGAVVQKLAASQKQFHYMNWEPSAIAQLEKQKGYRAGALTVEIPAGFFPKQDQSIIGINTVDGWMVHESFPEDLAYEFTRFLIKHGDKLGKYTAVGEFMGSVKAKSVGFTEENTHRGAIRAYKEAGLW